MQLYKNSTNIVRRAKLTDMPHYLKAYCLTRMSRKQRMQSIIESMDKFYYEFGGIQMVVIDGIADLIKGANDEGESIRRGAYIDLCEQIQAQLDVKDRTAKTYIKFMREKEIILKDPSN